MLLLRAFQRCILNLKSSCVSLEGQLRDLARDALPLFQSHTCVIGASIRIFLLPIVAF